MSTSNDPRHLMQEHAAAIDAQAFRQAGELWQRVQRSFAQRGCVEAQVALLESHGFNVTRRVAGLPTAIVAEAGAGGPVIAILGDADEAGGRDLQAAGAVLAALLAQDLLRAQGLRGTVRYHGCPAGATGAGKIRLVHAGAFAEADAALVWQPGTYNGVMQAVSPPAIEASFRFQGQSAHAAAAPELGRSALDAVELMNVGASFLREHGPAGAGIHFAVTDPGGTAPNVVQASAGVRYTAWAADATTARALHERLEAVARGAALMTGTTVEVALEQACAAFVPSPRLEQLLMAQLQALGSLDRGAGDAAARPDPLSSAITPLASGPRPMGLPCDLGDLSQAVPTVRYVSACFDVHAEPDTWRLPVQGEPSAAHQGALHAARVLAATALELARHPHDVQQARRELEHGLGGQHPSPVGGLLCPRR